MKLSANERQQNEMIEAMKRAKIAPGYFPHVESIISKYPTSKWDEIMRSISANGPAEWFQ